MNKQKQIEELAADIRGHQHATIFLARRIKRLIGESTTEKILCPNCANNLVEFQSQKKDGYERSWLCSECQKRYDKEMKEIITVEK